MDFRASETWLQGVEYGAGNTWLNVTYVALDLCVKNDILTIPAKDSVRAAMFGDPCYGTLKVVKVMLKGQPPLLVAHNKTCAVRVLGANPSFEAKRNLA